MPQVKRWKLKIILYPKLKGESLDPFLNFTILTAQHYVPYNILGFIDMEKAMSREILWKTLEKKCVKTTYIKVIKNMYERASTSMRTRDKITDYFSMKVCLHQG
jgi:hypothetical protein